MTTKIIRDGEGNEQAEPFKVEAFKEAQTVVPTAQEKTVSAGLVGDAEGIERDAYELGFKAGERAGFDVGSQKTAMVSAALIRLMDELSGFRDGLYKSAEAELTSLALAIARKVICRELELSNDVIRGAVKAAIDALSGGRELTIKINPKDMETLKEYRAELLEYGMEKGVRLQPDEAISRGGCIVETNFQEADATIDGCLQIIEDKLRG